jgi:hypothetical protein
MPLRTLAEFKTDLPDDTIWSDDGDIERFGGLRIAEVIRQFLIDQGFTVDQPEYADEHGWMLYVGQNGRRVSLQIGYVEDVILVSSEGLTLKGHLGFAGRSFHQDLLIALNSQMVSDGRFHRILWYTDREFDLKLPGYDTPA